MTDTPEPGTLGFPCYCKFRGIAFVRSPESFAAGLSYGDATQGSKKVRLRPFWTFECDLSADITGRAAVCLSSAGRERATPRSLNRALQANASIFSGSSPPRQIGGGLLWQPPWPWVGVRNHRSQEGNQCSMLRGGRASFRPNRMSGSFPLYL